MAQGAVPMGELGWERARVLAGRPAPGAELTLDHTPLEAGLGGAVSLDKGCYIGQEARPRPHPPALVCHLGLGVGFPVMRIICKMGVLWRGMRVA